MQLLSLFWSTTSFLASQANADFWAVDYHEAFQEGFKFIKDPPKCTASLHNAVLYPQYPSITGSKKGRVYIQIGDVPSLLECNTTELGSFSKFQSNLASLFPPFPFHSSHFFFLNCRFLPTFI
jgi:hypothetical protein